MQEIYKHKGEFDLFSIRKTYGEREIISLVQDGKKWLSHLPEKAVYSESKAPSDVFSKTLAAARESGNATFDIRLFPGTDRHSVPQHILSSLCSSVSSLFSSISGGRMGKEISVSTLRGSCVVRFSFPEKINLSDDNNVVDEIRILNDVLSSDSIYDGIRDVKDKGRFVRAYSEFLKTVSKTDSAVQIAVASPNSFYVNAIDLKSDVIRKRYGDVKDIYNIEKEETVLKGYLIALDTKTKKFKFQAEDGNVKSGTVDAKVLESAVYEIPAYYTASISIEKHIDKSGNINSYKYFINSME